ncbi:HDOD domain-containing protein [Pseudoalteromonas fenneropenaei]|uniref:HDOD domain-containing protein n=1 Tax=Pseudoalteromonas fenneropenaei TaxID=1737459 RepID=A0ABV7CFL1_9GAMM
MSSDLHGQLTALIIDDDTLMLRSLNRVLKQLEPQLHIVCLDSPAKLDETLASLPNLHLLIADYLMPVMLGTEVIKQVSSRYVGLITVLITGEASGKALDGNSIQCSYFLSKPFEMAQFEQIMADVKVISRLKIEREVKQQLEGLFVKGQVSFSMLNLLNALNDPFLDFIKLQKLLSPDPLLTTRIIHLSNSAYFGQRAPNYTLEGAIKRLGLEMIRRITCAMVCGDVFCLVADKLQIERLVDQHLLNCHKLTSILKAAGYKTQQADKIAYIHTLLLIGELTVKTKTIISNGAPSSVYLNRLTYTCYVAALLGFERDVTNFYFNCILALSSKDIGSFETALFLLADSKDYEAEHQKIRQLISISENSDLVEMYDAQSV